MNTHSVRIPPTPPYPRGRGPGLVLSPSRIGAGLDFRFMGPNRTRRSYKGMWEEAEWQKRQSDRLLAQERYWRKSIERALKEYGKRVFDKLTKRKIKKEIALSHREWMAYAVYVGASPRDGDGMLQLLFRGIPVKMRV